MTAGPSDAGPAFLEGWASGLLASGRPWAASLGSRSDLVVHFVVSDGPEVSWWECVRYAPEGWFLWRGGWAPRGSPRGEQGPFPSLDGALRPAAELPDRDREDLVGRFADPLPYLSLLGVMGS